MFVFFKQKTAYEMRISDWSSACALPISRTGEIQGGAEPLLRPCLARRPGMDETFFNLQNTTMDEKATGGIMMKNLFSSRMIIPEIGRASCRERVCQYV